MLNLRNKFIMAPIKLGYCKNNGIVNQKHIDFYNLRSKHIGAVTLEPLYMDQGLREIPSQLGIDDHNKIDGLGTLTDLIKANGAKTIAHLNHPGRMANPKIPGNYWWSSTDKECENGGAKPIRMNREMMNEVIEMFVKSAQRVVSAGFDIIELQFGHGYLLAQFLSPSVNDREDEYGGSPENRMKFPLEVAEAVRRSVKIPVIARISGDEIISDGFHVDDMVLFVKELEQLKYDAVHVSAGSSCSTPPWFFQHMFVPKGKTWEFAQKIQKEVSVPVIYVGQVNSVKDVNLLEKDYNASYIAVGRAMVADEDFAAKLIGKADGRIRPCLACAEGCLGGVKNGKGLGCVVNPKVNTEFTNGKKSDIIKKIAVIGGGLAGMQAATVLIDRGHNVDLYEKNALGGQFNLAWLPPGKKSLKLITDYFVNEMLSKDINVIYEEAERKNISNLNYDAVILATGAIPAVPKIKGLKKYYWTEFLNDDQLPSNKNILVIGGGLIGLEVASKLSDSNNKVYVVETEEEIARGMEMIEKSLTLKKLKTNNTELITKHTVTEVDGKTIIVKGENGFREIGNIDEIVVAVGMKSNLPFDDLDAVPVYFIGDANRPGKAQNAIHGAYELALKL